MFLSLLRFTVLGAAVATSVPGWAADRMQDLNSPLRGTRWTLQTLEGVAQAQVAGGTPVQLVLGRDAKQLSGHTGCNRLMGRYKQRGTLLTLSPLATTRMACAEPLMKQEQAVLTVLGQVDGYRIENRTLSLLQGEVVRATWAAPATPPAKP